MAAAAAAFSEAWTSAAVSLTIAAAHAAPPRMATSSHTPARGPCVAGRAATSASSRRHVSKLKHTPGSASCQEGALLPGWQVPGGLGSTAGQGPRWQPEAPQAARRPWRCACSRHLTAAHGAHADVLLGSRSAEAERGNASAPLYVQPTDRVDSVYFVDSVGSVNSVGPVDSVDSVDYTPFAGASSSNRRNGTNTHDTSTIATTTPSSRRSAGGGGSRVGTAVAGGARGYSRRTAGVQLGVLAGLLLGGIGGPLLTPGAGECATPAPAPALAPAPGATAAAAEVAPGGKPAAPEGMALGKMNRKAGEDVLPDGSQTLALVGNFSTFDTISVIKYPLDRAAPPASLDENVRTDVLSATRSAGGALDEGGDAPLSSDVSVCSFEYVTEVCRGKTEEGRGGVLECFSPKDGAPLETLVRRHVATVHVHNGEVYVMSASCADKSWPKIGSTLKAIVSSFSFS
eukprot:jgi/Mesen1/10344/ME000008S10120